MHLSRGPAQPASGVRTVPRTPGAEPGDSGGTAQPCGGHSDRQCAGAPEPAPCGEDVREPERWSGPGRLVVRGVGIGHALPGLEVQVHLRG